MTEPEPTEAEITDFIDGRLDGARRRRVEAWLAQNPDRAMEVDRQRQLNEALKNLGADILDEPVPERLREVLQRPVPERPARTTDGATSEPRDPRGSSPSRPKRLFLALALLAIGAAAGWIGRSALEPQQAALDLLLADAAHAFAFYSADRNYAVQYPPERMAEFAKVSAELFEREVVPPDLGALGYRFRGARIAPLGRLTSAFFFFESPGDGANLTVVFWPHGEQPPAPGFRTIGGVSARFWFSEGLGFAVMGDGDEAKLTGIGDQVVAFYGHTVGS